MFFKERFNPRYLFREQVIIIAGKERLGTWACGFYLPYILERTGYRLLRWKRVKMKKRITRKGYFKKQVRRLVQRMAGQIGSPRQNRLRAMVYSPCTVTAWVFFKKRTPQGGHKRMEEGDGVIKNGLLVRSLKERVTG